MKTPTLIIDDTLNDDWIKNVDPEMARREIEIHEALAKKYVSRETLKGGKGSGFYGHAGRIGKHGGSAPQSGSISEARNTDSESFKKWFGDSQVVDENGRPLVVYHGTDKDFGVYGKFGKAEPLRTFNRPTLPELFWFTDDTPTANYYAKTRGNAEGANIQPVYLKIENPYIVKGINDLLSPGDATGAIEDAIGYGHDGVIFEWNETVGTKVIKLRSYVVFNPNQIKSVFNKGTFDPSDPSILKETTTKGGPGSGYFGHRGRPGKKGGSAPDGGSVSASFMTSAVDPNGVKSYDTVYDKGLWDSHSEDFRMACYWIDPYGKIYADLNDDYHTMIIAKLIAKNPEDFKVDDKEKELAEYLVSNPVFEDERLEGVGHRNGWTRIRMVGNPTKKIGMHVHVGLPDANKSYLRKVQRYFDNDIIPWNKGTVVSITDSSNNHTEVDFTELMTATSMYPTGMDGMIALKENKKELEKTLKATLRRKVAVVSKPDRFADYRPELRQRLFETDAAISELMFQLYSQKITLDEFQEAMGAILGFGMVEGYLSGKGTTIGKLIGEEEELEPEAAEKAKNAVAPNLAIQLGFLAGFVAVIAGWLARAANKEIPYEQLPWDAWKRRASMYTTSIVEPFWKGTAEDLNLPAYPGDGSTACITTPYSLVKTRRGLIPIKDIVIGDFVWTHKNRWRKVINTSVTYSKKGREYLRITSPNGALIDCTADHEWLTDDGWKHAIDIYNSGDPVYNGLHDKKMRKMWKPDWEPKYERLMQELSFTLSVREKEGLQSGGMRFLRSQTKCSETMGYSRIENAKIESSFDRTAVAQTNANGINRDGFYGEKSGRATLCKILYGRETEQIHLSLPMGLGTNQRADSAGLRDSSQGWGSNERQHRQLGVINQKRSLKIARDDSPRKKSLCNLSDMFEKVSSAIEGKNSSDKILFCELLPHSSEDSNKTKESDLPGLFERVCFPSTYQGGTSILFQRMSLQENNKSKELRILSSGVQFLPSQESPRSKILFKGVLQEGQALYDITVEEDHSFVVEGLVSHNCNQSCKCEWKIVALDAEKGDFDAYWLMHHPAEHCAGCLERSERWNPFKIRGWQVDMPDTGMSQGRSQYPTNTNESGVRLMEAKNFILDKLNVSRETFKGGTGSGNFGHAGRIGKRGGSAPNNKGSVSEFRISTGEGTTHKQDIPQDIRNRRFFHATDNEAAAQAIINSGEIRAGEHETNSQMAPAKDRLYLSQDSDYAVIYALGGDVDNINKPGQSGYIFEVDGNDFNNIQPDEDYIGGLLSNEKAPYWLSHMAKYNLSANTLYKLKRGEYSYFASAGKKLVRLMNDQQKFELISSGASIAHLGSLKIKKAWKLDKGKTWPRKRLLNWNKTETPEDYNDRTAKVFSQAEEIPLGQSAKEFIKASLKGGVGSGFYGHAGRPGKKGGSAAQSGSISMSQNELTGGLSTLKFIGRGYGVPPKEAITNGKFDSGTYIPSLDTLLSRGDRDGKWGLNHEGTLSDLMENTKGIFDSEVQKQYMKGLKAVERKGRAEQKRTGFTQNSRFDYETEMMPSILESSGLINVRATGEAQFNFTVAKLNNATLKYAQRFAEEYGLSKKHRFVLQEYSEGAAMRHSHPKTIGLNYAELMAADHLVFRDGVPEIKEFTTKGGGGSGNHGHAGIPGHYGGSAPKSGFLPIREMARWKKANKKIGDARQKLANAMLRLKFQKELNELGAASAMQEVSQYKKQYNDLNDEAQVFVDLKRKLVSKRENSEVDSDDWKTYQRLVDKNQVDLDAKLNEVSIVKEKYDDASVNMAAILNSNGIQKMEFDLSDAQYAYSDLFANKLGRTGGKSYGEVALEGNIKLSAIVRERAQGDLKAAHDKMDAFHEQYGKIMDEHLKFYHSEMEAKTEGREEEAEKWHVLAKETWLKMEDLDKGKPEIQKEINQAIAGLEKTQLQIAGKTSFVFASDVDEQIFGASRTYHQESLNTFNQLIGDNPLMGSYPVRVQFSVTERAHQWDGNVVIGVNRGDMIHELGHELEGRDFGIGYFAESFLAKRTQGESLEYLSQLTGNKGYKPDEVAKKDKFIHPYMGKIYSHKATEIISMGLQYMHENPYQLATQDPEYYDFIWGITRLG